MKDSRKMARMFLDGLTKTKFNKVLDELNLSDEQKTLLILKHVCRFDNLRISIKMNKCRNFISLSLQNIYDKIYKNFIA